MNAAGTGLSVLSLGAHVVAEHPAGHRVVGTIRGIGTVGVMVSAKGFPSTPLLLWEDGWTIVPGPGSEGPITASRGLGADVSDPEPQS
jgi:hypothetical protein